MIYTELISWHATQRHAAQSFALILSNTGDMKSRLEIFMYSIFCGRFVDKCLHII